MAPRKRKARGGSGAAVGGRARVERKRKAEATPVEEEEDDDEDEDDEGAMEEHGLQPMKGSEKDIDDIEPDAGEGAGAEDDDPAPRRARPRRSSASATPTSGPAANSRAKRPRTSGEKQTEENLSNDNSAVADDSDNSEESQVKRSEKNSQQSSTRTRSAQTGSERNSSDEDARHPCAKKLAQENASTSESESDAVEDDRPALDNSPDTDEPTAEGVKRGGDERGNVAKPSCSEESKKKSGRDAPKLEPATEKDHNPGVNDNNDETAVLMDVEKACDTEDQEPNASRGVTDSIQNYWRQVDMVRTTNHPSSVASVAVAVADDLMTWAIEDVCMSFMRRKYCAASFAKPPMSPADKPSTSPSPPKPESGPSSTTPAVDTNGRAGSENNSATTGRRVTSNNKSVTIECSNCGTNIAGARYAPHLEKCLGRGGRSSSRAASARLRANAYSESENSDGEDDFSVQSRGRGRIRRAGSGTFGAAISKQAPGKKSRSSSPPPTPSGSDFAPPPPSSSNNAASKGVGNRSGLPPSGRPRPQAAPGSRL